MLKAVEQRSVPRGARREVGFGSWTLDAADWCAAFSASWCREGGGARILDTGCCRLVCSVQCLVVPGGRWCSDPGHWMLQAGEQRSVPCGARREVGLGSWTLEAAYWCGDWILNTGCGRLVWGSDPGHWMLQTGVQHCACT
ncbi:hypothetical protein NDU88_010976 [Pleurodeles waltl]|uniref:Uncharacterized protein n=1 Tax=Pleurodeles waltl TaxID=8319 RepID=A0AAV7S5K8_PLEWA|nr:hypothetical protein NDU88_010976 [Pleurodeles waltl]